MLRIPPIEERRILYNVALPIGSKRESNLRWPLSKMIIDHD
jgi:hypothetical protein